MALDATDYSTNTNDLTITGATESTSSTPFAASTSVASFDGNDYLEITDASQSGLDLSTDFTIEFWVKFAAFPASGVFYAWVTKDANGQRQYFIGILGNNKCPYLFFFDNAGNYTSARTTNGLTDGELNTWIHFAFVADISVPSITIYKNGSSVAVTTDTTAATTLGNKTSSFIVGGRKYSGTLDSPHVGQMDEVRVWSDIRTSTEISDNMSVELTGSEANLVAYYPFESLGGGATSGPSSWKTLTNVGEG